MKKPKKLEWETKTTQKIRLNTDLLKGVTVKQ